MSREGAMLKDSISEPNDKERHGERAWEWYRRIGSPRWVCAPMVGGSELAFRLLVRQYGVQLTYTPMISARAFLGMRTDRERGDFIEPHTKDRPLIVQFCTNDPDEFLEAALLVQDYCDAVDLNLGCPKDMGRRYGAVLMEEPDVVREIVRRAASSPKMRVPITCKIRVWRDRERSINFARMLQDSGCQLLTVHGRTRTTHVEEGCDWQTVAAIKQALNIPVLANGGMVRTLRDAEKFQAATGADGVMSAVGLLLNPKLFSSTTAQQHFNSISTSLQVQEEAAEKDGAGRLNAISYCFEYLALAESIPTTHDKYIREHLEYLLRPLACPTHKSKHNCGSDEHADIWGLLTNSNNLRSAQQATKLVEILAWRLGHRSATVPPKHSLKDIKKMRGAVLDDPLDSYLYLFP